MLGALSSLPNICVPIHVCYGQTTDCLGPISCKHTNCCKLPRPRLHAVLDERWHRRDRQADVQARNDGRDIAPKGKDVVRAAVTGGGPCTPMRARRARRERERRRAFEEATRTVHRLASAPLLSDCSPK